MSKKLKVAMYTTIGDHCGIAVYTRDLTSALCALPDVEIVTVPITEGKQDLAHYTEIAERLNAPDIDLIHLQHEHSFWGNVMPNGSAFWEMRYLLKKPLVLTAHTTYSLAQMLRVKKEKRIPHRLAKEILIRRKSYRDSVEIAPFATALTIVHTEAARHELIGRGAKPNYVAVIPAGILPVTQTGDAERFLSRYGLQKDDQKPLILTIFGYTAPNKGYEPTLDVLKTLARNVHLVIAGGARNSEMQPYLDRLTEHIEADNDLSKRVTITGFLADSEIADVMAATDLVLVPHTEATGSYSVTVPLAYGKPILASDQDCFVEINTRKPCLKIFKSGDREDFARQLADLLAQPEARNTLATQAREYARKYDWNFSARLTQNVYFRAIELFSPGNW